MEKELFREKNKSIQFACGKREEGYLVKEGRVHDSPGEVGVKAGSDKGSAGSGF
jgi:hypothetical protein